MKPEEVRTTRDLLSVLNQTPYEPIIDLGSTEVDSACRITNITLDPLTDKIDGLDIEILHIDNISPSRFKQETLEEVKTLMLGHWAVRKEAQCNVQYVLDMIMETSGYRGTLYDWLFMHDEESEKLERLSGLVDQLHDSMQIPTSCDKCAHSVSEEHYGHTFYACRHKDAEVMSWGKYTDYIPCDCPLYDRGVANA